MADVRTIIDVDLNTSAATAKLRQLQREVNAFTLGLNKGNILQVGTIKQVKEQLLDLANSSRFFTGEVVRMRTAAARLDSTLSRGQATMGQFLGARFRKDSFAAAQVLQLANERARSLQTQFIATAGAANGFQEAVAIRPLAAFNNAVSVSTQRLAIQRAMFRQATTSMINFGKNVQWAGRQLMVGFTVPLTIFGAVAGKAFRDLEKEAVNFKKVYGDVFTTETETEKMLEEVKGLTKEFTKYGIAAQKTMQLAAVAAQAGQQGAELIAATREAIRLSTLGDMEQEDAMRTAIALQSAFKLSSDELAESINYLNFVENSTVLSLQDLAAAIPRVAPVIVGLGGNVRDMSIFLAAMREGGVTASEAANGLKSSLGRLITPTKQATEMAASFGINLERIVQVNRGDLLGTVMELANAMKSLGNIEKQQLLSTLFGKFQYARIGALFENITREGSQANRLIQDIGISTQQLAQTADKELSAIENSVSVKFTKAMEDLKLAIAPIGELFIKLSIPVVKFLSKIAEAFNNLPDFAKTFIAGGVAITGIFIPAVVMIFGLLANLTGQLLKMGGAVAMFIKGFTTGGLRGAIDAVRQSFQYMSLAELDTAVASGQLAQATGIVNQALLDQVLRSEGASAAIAELGAIYDLTAAKARNFASAQQAALFVPARGMTIARGTTPPPVARNTGGTIPGFGPNKDSVPAVLTPGEYVVNRDATRKNFQLLQAINNGDVQGFNNGGLPGAGPSLFMQRVRGTQQIRTQMAAQEAKEKQLENTHIYFSGKRRLVKYDDIDPRIGGSQVDNLRTLSKLGFPVEQLDDKFLRLPFNKALVNGIKGARIRKMIEEMDPDIDILGPAFKRANVDQKKLLENILATIDDRTIYYDYGPNAFGKIVSSALGGTKVTGLPSQLRLGTHDALKSAFPNDFAIAMASPGQRIPAGRTGASFLYEDGNMFVVDPSGVKLMSSGTRGHRLNRGGGVARPGRMFYGNILNAVKISRSMAKAAWGGKYPPLFSPAIPGTKMYGFGEGARQPMMRGASGTPTTLMNLIRQVSTDPRFGERLQARVLINGQEAVINRIGSRQLDRLGRSRSTLPISLETRPISKAREEQFMQQWIAAGKPGMTRGNNFSEYKAFEDFMLQKGFHRNQRQGYFYKPLRIGLNDSILGEVLMPRSMMDRQQQEFNIPPQRFMAGGMVFSRAQIQKIVSKLGPEQAQRYFAGIQTSAADQKIINSVMSQSVRMSPGPSNVARIPMNISQMDSNFDQFKWTRLSGKYMLSENAVNSMLRSGQKVIYYPDIRTGQLQSYINKNQYVVSKKGNRFVFNDRFGLETTLPKSADGNYNVFSPDDIFYANQGGKVPGLQYFAKENKQRIARQLAHLDENIAMPKNALRDFINLKSTRGAKAKSAFVAAYPAWINQSSAAGMLNKKDFIKYLKTNDLEAYKFLFDEMGIPQQQRKNLTTSINNEIIKNLENSLYNVISDEGTKNTIKFSTVGDSFYKAIPNKYKKVLDKIKTTVAEIREPREGGRGTERRFRKSSDLAIVKAMAKVAKKSVPILRGRAIPIWNMMNAKNSGGIIPGYNAGGNVMKSFISGRVFDSSRKTIVPGAGNTDTVAAALTPGEFVVNKDATKKNLGLLKAINSGVAAYARGGIVEVNSGMMDRGNQPIRYYQANMPDGSIRLFSTRSDARKAIRLAKPTSGMRGMGASMVGGMAGSGLMIYGQQLQSEAMARGEESKAGSGLSQLGMGAMALSSLAMFGKGGLIVAGLLAAVGVAFKLSGAIKEANASGAKFLDAMHGSQKAVEATAEAMGRLTNIQKTGFREALKFGTVEEEQLNFAQQYIQQTDPGKQLIKDMKLVQKSGNDTAKALRNQLGRLLLSGVIDPKEANAIAMEVGRALNDATLAANVIGQIKEIVGPDGKKMEGAGALSLAATISPEMNEEDVSRLAKTQLESMGKMEWKGFGFEQFFAGMDNALINVGKAFGLINQKQVENEIVARNIVDAAQMEATARANVLNQLQQGVISAKEYLDLLNKVNEGADVSSVIAETLESKLLDPEYYNKVFNDIAKEFPDLSTEELNLATEERIGKETKKIVDQFDKQWKTWIENSPMAPLESDIDDFFDQTGISKDPIVETKIKAEIVSGEIDPTILQGFLTGKLQIPDLIKEQGPKAVAEHMKTIAGQFALISRYPDLAEKVMLETDGFKNTEEDLKKVNEALAELETINPNILQALEIDPNKLNAAELEKWTKVAPELEKQWGALERLNPAIDLNAFIKANALDENGKPISLEQMAKNVKQANKAYDNLAKSDSKTIKEATITYAESIAGDPNIKGEDVWNTINKHVKDFNNLQIEDKVALITIATRYVDLMGKMKDAQSIAEAAYYSNQAAEEEKELQEKSIAAGINKGKDSGGGGGTKSLLQQLQENAKLAQDTFAGLGNVVNEKGFKKFIAGPFAPEFLEYLRSQGEQGLKIIQGGLNKIKEAYSSFIKDRTASLAAQAMTTPFRLAEERRGRELGQGLEQRLAGRGMSQEQIDYIRDIITDEQLLARVSLKRRIKEEKDIKKRQELQKQLNALIKEEKSAIQESGRATDKYHESMIDLQTSTTELNKQAALFKLPGMTEELAQAMVKANITIDSGTDKINNFKNAWHASKQAALAALGPEGIQKYMRDLQSQLNDVNKEIAMIEIVEPLEKEMQGLEKQNETLSRRIELLERTKEPIQEEIDRINEIIDLRQRDIELLNRRIEPLEEEKERIEEIYQSQIEALDKVSQKEDLLFRKRQGQMNVAQALSRGDVAGAAQAALAARQDMASARRDQTRQDLETRHKENIKKIDNEINEIRKQTEAIEKQIRDYQDQTYNLTLQLKPIDEEIKNLKLQQRNIQDQIYGLQLRINAATDELNEKFDSAAIRLANLRAEAERLKNELLEAAAASARIAVGGNRGGAPSPSTQVVDPFTGRVPNVGPAPSQEERQVYESYGLEHPYDWSPQTWQEHFAEQANWYAYGGKVKKMAYGGRVNYRGSRELPPGMAFGGKVKKYAYGSFVPGMGNTDRVPALLTPGEYVINKTSSKQFLPLLQAMNESKFPSFLNPSNVMFDVPASNMGQLKSNNNTSKTIIAPSNYTYELTVNVPNTDASPDQIANAVIGKIKMMENKNVRSIRI